MAGEGRSQGRMVLTRLKQAKARLTSRAMAGANRGMPWEAASSFRANGRQPDDHAQARKVLRRFQKMHAEHADAENASQAVHNALDLEARIAGVYCCLCCSGFQRNSRSGISAFGM